MRKQSDGWKREPFYLACPDEEGREAEGQAREKARHNSRALAPEFQNAVASLRSLRPASVFSVFRTSTRAGSQALATEFLIDIAAIRNVRKRMKINEGDAF
jgi:hypothetical protein